MKNTVDSFVDNRTTITPDKLQAMHNFKYKYDPKYKKNVDYQKWAESVDKPLYDSSLEIIPGLTNLINRTVGKILPKDSYFTVYHGTSPDIKSKIVANGLQTKYTGLEDTLTRNALGNTVTGDMSKGLVFTTSSKWDAARYAASHDPTMGKRIDNTSPISDQIKKLSRQIKSYVTDDGIVTMILPNNMSKYEVLNPEAALLISDKFKTLPINSVPNKYISLQRAPKGLTNMVAAEGFGKDKVFIADIPSKYVKGSKDYQLPVTGDSIPYYETLANRDELARELNDAVKRLDIAKRIATHTAVNEALQYDSASIK